MKTTRIMSRRLLDVLDVTTQYLLGTECTQLDLSLHSSFNARCYRGAPPAVPMCCCNASSHHFSMALWHA